MANNVKFEGKDRRMPGIEKFLAENGLGSLEECRDLCLSKGIDVDAIVINNQNERVTSAYNAQGEFYNNFYKIDTMIYIDLDENGAVFVAGEGTVPTITLNKSTATVVEDATTSISATVSPAGSTVTWKSSDESVATVSSGTVTGVAAGTATISAIITVSGVPYGAQCVVTVTAANDSKKAASSKKAAE